MTEAKKPLAVVGKVIDLAAIEGADRIRCATVVCGPSGRWKGVVGLDVAPGELVTVFLQDAVLQPDDRWPFMEKHKWRVRMCRFKGVPSECLIVRGAPSLDVGVDLTAALGVTKHEKPIPTSMQGDAVGEFPGFIPKTDEENFQRVPELVARMSVDRWHACEKADGSSGTAWTDESGLHVASRNWELREFTASGASNAYWRAARKYGMDRLPAGLALQFEVVGPGIQGNPLGLKDIEARAFTLYDFAEHRRRPRADLLAVCGDLGVPMAPLLHSGPVDDMPAYSDEGLRAMAEIRYASGKHGEGIVIRADDSSWSFKVINLLYKD